LAEFKLKFLMFWFWCVQDNHLLWLAYILLALCTVLCIVSLPVPMVGWAGTQRDTSAAGVAKLAPMKNEVTPPDLAPATRSPAKNSQKGRSGGSKRLQNVTVEAPPLAGSPPPPPLPTVAAAEGLF
jgi:hypothetical protein